MDLYLHSPVHLYRMLKHIDNLLFLHFMSTTWLRKWILKIPSPLLIPIYHTSLLLHLQIISYLSESDYFTVQHHRIWFKVLDTIHDLSRIRFTFAFPHCCRHKMALPANYKAIAAASPVPAVGNRELSSFLYCRCFTSTLMFSCQLINVLILNNIRLMY